MDSNNKMARVERAVAVGNNGGHGGEHAESSGGDFVDPIDGLIEQLRREAHAAERARAGTRKERTEAMYQAVLKKLSEEEERRRKSWSAKTLRGLSSLGATASALWNSRAVRMLVP